MVLFNTKMELLTLFVSLLPAIYFIYYYFFIATNDGERKHKGYHISGKYGMIFLWFTLLITPIYDITEKQELLSIKIIFGIVSEIYVIIHSFLYLRYTLGQDGYTLTAFINQIKARDYLIYGIISSIFVMLSMVTFNNKYFPIGATLFASYHIMTRNWNRINRGKSPVKNASVVPYITAILFIYQIFSILFF